MTQENQSVLTGGKILFGPHGTRVNEIDGRILVSRWQGPFNLELLKAASAPTLDLRRTLMDTGHWGYIAIIERSGMATQDAIAELKHLVEDPERSSNRVAAAVVLAPDLEGRIIAESIYTHIWKDVLHPFKIFARFSEARDWVNDQLGTTSTRLLP